MSVDLSLATYSILGLYRHGYVYEGADGRVYISVPERLPNMEFVDGQMPSLHRCSGGGETLMGVAIQHYRADLEYPVDAWEVIAQFQNDPVRDPFAFLDHDRLLAVPPVPYFNSVVYGEPLYRETLEL